MQLTARKVSVMSENTERGDFTSGVVIQHPKPALRSSREGYLLFSQATAFAKSCLVQLSILAQIAKSQFLFYHVVNSGHIIHKAQHTTQHYQYNLAFVLGTNFCQLQKLRNSQFLHRDNPHNLQEAASPGSYGSKNVMGPDPGVAASQQSQILPIN